jgi:[calcium/calmodulin-dependent protein kinase] kinase
MLQVDIWSLGATLYNMVVGKPPWMAQNQIQLAHQIQHIELAFPTELELDPHLKNLLRRMLQKDPEKRIRLEDIIEHDWVTNEGAEPLTPEDESVEQTEQLQEVQVTQVDVEQAVTVHPSVLRYIASTYTDCTLVVYFTHLPRFGTTHEQLRAFASAN